MRMTPGVIFALDVAALGYLQVVPQNGDWPECGRDPGGSRYSPLTQIYTANVDHLARAWTYHTGETGRSFEATPILVNNVLYFPTQNQNIVALNPETGGEI
jgi:glucose dehydrogenase